LTRPTLANHVSPEELAWRSGDLFKWIAEGKLQLRIDKEYPLADARQAQEDLEARKSTGKLILKT
jgi:NADPH2:quinone reductase